MSSYHFLNFIFLVCVYVCACVYRNQRSIFLQLVSTFFVLVCLFEVRSLTDLGFTDLARFADWKALGSSLLRLPSSRVCVCTAAPGSLHGCCREACVLSLTQLIAAN